MPAAVRSMKYYKLSAQDRGSFWFLHILNEILQYIDMWN